MLTEKEAVIFDLDGTLVDSMWIWKDIDKEYLGRYGITPPEKMDDYVDGMSFSDTAVFFKEKFKLPDSLEKIKADWNAMARDKYMHEVPLKEGAREFLEYCKKHGIKMGIATSNSVELVQNVAKVHGLHNYFSVIKADKDVKHGKPAPDIYLSVAEELNVESDKCLVFEDMPAGILAGKGAGMTVCAVEDAYTAPKEQEKKSLADYYIRDYYDLKERYGY